MRHFVHLLRLLGLSVMLVATTACAILSAAYWSVELVIGVCISITAALAGLLYNWRQRVLFKNLHQSDLDRLNAVMAASPVALLIIDEHRQVTHVNPRAESMFGMTLAQIQSQPCGESMACPHRLKNAGQCGQPHCSPGCSLVAAVNNALENCRSTLDQHMLLRQPEAAATELCLTFSVASVLIGGRRQAVVALDDITDRRRAEQALRQSEERLQLAIDASSDGIFEWPDMTVPRYWWSPRFYELMGYQLGELDPCEATFIEMLHPDDRARIRDEIAACSAVAGSFEMEFRLLTKPGDYRWYLARGKVQLDAHQRPHRMLGSVRDITATKQAEVELRETKEEYRRLFELESDAIILVDNESGRILEANIAATTLYGYTRDEWLNMKHTDVSAQPDQTRDAALQGSTHVAERWHKKKDGTVFPVEITATHFEWKGHSVHLAAIRDITARVRAEQSLRERESILRYIVQHDPNAIAVYDRELRYVAVSNRYLDDYNVRDIDIIGKHHYEIFPEMPERWKDVHRRCLAGAVERNDDDCFVRPDGSITYNRWECRPWYREDGEIGGMVTYTEVTTERKKAEEALRRSEEQLRLFVGQVPATIAMFDVNVCYIAASDRWREDYRLGTQEIIGRCHYDVFPEIPERWKEVHRRCLAGAVERCDEDRFERADGTVQWLRWEVRPWYKGDGEVGGLMFNAEDITSRKQAEDALRDKEWRYQQLFNSIGDAVFLHGVGEDGWPGQFVEVNDVACKRLGYSREELLQMRPMDIEAPESRVLIPDIMRKWQVEGRVTWEGVHKASDGRRIPVEISNTVFFTGGKRLVLSTVRDISDRKRLEDQLRQSQKMEAIGQLAGGVAHDFRNQLTVIKGFGEMLMRRSLVKDEGKDKLQEILKAAERSSLLTGQLLAFSRKQTLDLQRVDLADLVADVAKAIPRLMGEDVRLHVHASGPRCIVQLDPGLFQQALINLAVNARDAMPNGGDLTISTSRLVVDDAFLESHPDAKPGAYAVVEVRDTGCGMDAQVLDRLFEPFFTTKEIGRGTGLGLAMVYGFVQQSGGGIEVKSKPNEGSIFRLRFPEHDGQDQGGSQPVEPQERLLGGQETILVVEDEEALRKLLVASLREAGYAVREASNVQQAGEELERPDNNIELLITDVVMPGGSGVDLAQNIKRIRPTMPILFMSGYPDRELVRRNVSIDAGRLLVKPFALETLLAKVRQVLHPTAERQGVQ